MKKSTLMLLNIIMIIATMSIATATGGEIIIDYVGNYNTGDTIAWGVTATQKYQLGQKIILTEPKIIDRVGEIITQGKTGTPTGYYTVAIYNDSGNTPSSLAKSQATLTKIAYSLPNSTNTIEYDFENNFTLNAGAYWVLLLTNETITGTIKRNNINYDQVSPTYILGGIRKIDSGAWTNVSVDFPMRIYGWNTTPENNDSPIIISTNPLNKTTIINSNANITITTNKNSYCKYANSPFDYQSAGTIMTRTTTNKTHWYTKNTMSNTTYNIYYKCSNLGNNVSDNYKHTIRGNTIYFNNTLAVVGDSVVQGLEVTATQRFNHIIKDYLNDTEQYLGLMTTNYGISGSCLSDFGECSSKNPIIDRLNNITNKNHRIIYLMPTANDNAYSVPSQELKEDLITIIDTFKNINYNSTIILSTLATSDGTNQLRDENTTAQYNSVVREVAIIKEIPFFEWHYIENHDPTNLVDFVHMSSTGHELLNRTLLLVINNLDNYKMTSEEFDFYHDCNKTTSMMNYTIDSPNNNCYANISNDWTIINNIRQDGFYINRTDKPFTLNISYRYEESTNYSVNMSNGTKINYLTDSDGNISLEFATINDLTITINKITEGINQQPIITTKNPQTPKQENAPTTIIFFITVNDPENDTITYQWYYDNTIQTGEDNNEYTKTFTNIDEGTHNITVGITDGTTIIYETWSITITTGYQQTYDSEDAKKIIIDGIAKFLIVIVVNASVIGIMLLAIYFLNKKQQKNK